MIYVKLYVLAALLSALLMTYTEKGFEPFDTIKGRDVLRSFPKLSLGVTGVALFVAGLLWPVDLTLAIGRAVRYLTK